MTPLVALCVSCCTFWLSAAMEICYCAAGRLKKSSFYAVLKIGSETRESEVVKACDGEPPEYYSSAAPSKCVPFLKDNNIFSLLLPNNVAYRAPNLFFRGFWISSGGRSRAGCRGDFLNWIRVFLCIMLC